MTVKEIKKFLKDHKVTYEQFAEVSGLPLNTLKNVCSERTPNPRVDTMQAIEQGIVKIKMSAGEYPVDIEEFDKNTRDNELAKKISELPPELQESLFAFIEQTIKLIKK